MIPKDYVIIANDLSIASIIDPLLILSMIGLLILESVQTGDTIPLISYFKSNRSLVK